MPPTADPDRPAEKAARSWRIRGLGAAADPEEVLFWSAAQGWVDAGYDVWTGERPSDDALPSEAAWEGFDAATLPEDHAAVRRDYYRDGDAIPSPLDLPIKVSFLPQAWVNDYAVECDRKGPDEWIVFGDEVEEAADLSHDAGRDFLKDSRWAPRWVRDWSGPFEVRLAGVPSEDDETFLRDARRQDRWEAAGRPGEADGCAWEDLNGALSALRLDHPDAAILRALRRATELFEVRMADAEPDGDDDVEEAA